MKKNIFKNKGGYTLLFSVLVSSIVLAVGISILTISKKEFLLSSSARESIVAFYAADSGLECGIFNDSSGNFSTTTEIDAKVKCFGEVLINPTKDLKDTFSYVSSESGSVGTFTFHVNKTGSSACAVVSVRKYIKDYLGEDTIFTQIISDGYNLGWNSTAGTCTDSSPKRVQREIEQNF